MIYLLGVADVLKKAASIIYSTPFRQESGGFLMPISVNFPRCVTIADFYPADL
jgi:hypothetical protein